MNDSIYVFLKKKELEDFYKSGTYLRDALALFMRMKFMCDLYTMHLLMYFVTGEWCFPGDKMGSDNALVNFLHNNQMLKVEELVTMDYEDFERFYGYKINPSYF